MRRTWRKQLAFALALSVLSASFGVVNTKAENIEVITEEKIDKGGLDELEEAMDAASASEIVSEIIYSDANVSISSALDRYIASNSNSALYDILGLAAEKKEEKDNKETENSEEEAKEELEDSESEKVQDEKYSSSSYIDFSNKAVITASGQVNIRKESNADSDKIGIISGGGIVTVVEKGSEWSHISSGGCDGYIKNEFMTFGDDARVYAEKNLPKVAVVNATTLRLRKSDSEDSECLTLLTGGEEYGIISQGDSWTHIEVDDSLSGYVRNDYISISYRMNKAVAVNEDTTVKNADNTNTTEQADVNETTTEAKEESTQETVAVDEEQTAEEATETIQPDEPEENTLPQAPAVNPNVSSVVNYALQFVGNPYVYGGSSLTDGTDCSGFTMSVYANFGVYLPHSSAAQANCGTEVSLSEVQAGDLVFYKNGGSTIGHVALCIGGGQVVHASTESTGIIVSNMYYSTPCKAVRVY